MWPTWQLAKYSQAKLKPHTHRETAGFCLLTLEVLSFFKLKFAHQRANFVRERERERKIRLIIIRFFFLQTCSRCLETDAHTERDRDKFFKNETFLLASFSSVFLLLRPLSRLFHWSCHLIEPRANQTPNQVGCVNSIRSSVAPNGRPVVCFARFCHLALF